METSNEYYWKFKKNKVLRRKYQRYEIKIKNLKSLIVYLEQNKCISDNTRQMLNVGTFEQ